MLGFCEIPDISQAMFICDLIKSIVKNYFINYGDLYSYKVDDDSPIEAQINYYLYTEINPGLASHGGTVNLVGMVEEEGKNIAILQFGGGCQGCSSVDLTLKDGVEKTLVEKVPGLDGVRDETDHTMRDNAYM